jgi:hypothetical protein
MDNRRKIYILLLIFAEVFLVGVSGFVGILLSPAHLCLFLTLDYFRAAIRETYKILVWPALVIFLAAFSALLFLRII